MIRKTKATVVGNVICTRQGKPLARLQGKTGNILTYTQSGQIAIMLIDGIRYPVPVSMIETTSPGEGGAIHG